MFTTSGLKNALSKTTSHFYTQHQLTWRDHSTHGSCSPLTTESSLRHVHINFWPENLSKTTGYFYTQHQLTWRDGSCSLPATVSCQSWIQIEACSNHLPEKYFIKLPARFLLLTSANLNPFPHCSCSLPKTVLCHVFCTA